METQPDNAVLFHQDDLQLRTLTTMLQQLHTSDTSTYEWTGKETHTTNFKRMLSISSMLARGPAEVVACMALSSLDGVVLFCVPNKKKTRRSDYNRHNLLCAKNPRQNERARNIQPHYVTVLSEPTPSFDNTIDYLLSLW